ncbi:DUF192 domain-containing protein [Rickettsiales bacterium]|nr:DUF192 domain-containing protein [Rickettsiales bacterium]
MNIKNIFFYIVTLIIIITPFFVYANNQQITIETKKGQKILFDVEIANNPESRQKGLMWREKMEPQNGMLFIFPENKIVNMWMKNTYLPLDMLFINEHGKIIHIHHNAEPLSTKNISFPKPARALLEINAGLSKKINIEVGDIVLDFSYKNAH